MKKYFIWIMIIGAILTISCDNMIPATAENESPAQNQSGQKAYLSVSLEQQTGRSILPQDNTVLEDLSYDLSGVRNGKEQNFGEFSYSELLNLRCEIMMGTWDFTLLAKRNGYLVLSGSVSGKTISVGNNSIAFTLHEAEDGVGDAAVRIRCPRNGVSSVCAILQNLSDGEEANRQVFTLSDCSDDAEKSEAVYKVSNLQKGFYRLYVRLYQNENDTTPINSQVVMVRVGAGCLSAGTMSFDTLNNYYTIIYHIGDMDLTADYILPTKYTVWDQINLPDESLFNVSNGEIVYGWYDNAALTGEQSVLIDYDSTGDREYWLDYKTIDDVFRTSVEHLAEVLARFKPLCGPYHVIITDSNPNLSSVADQLQANPTLRINLDLSECCELESIGNSAFYGCSGLTSVTIPDSVTSIGDYAFNGCSGLTGCITIPDGVTSIGRGAFSGCSNLTSVTIPDSVTSIVEYAFSGCISLTSVAIPGSVNTIGEGAFKGCSELESVSIQNGVREIGKEAFNKCSSLTSIVIPDSVTSIGAQESAMDNFSGGVFSGCSSLESITIPFVGEKKNFDRLGAAMVFGYIFGTLSYEGGVAVEQDYSLDLSSTSSIHHGKRTYYIPASLKNVTVTGSNDYYDNIAGHEVKHYTGLLYGAFSNCSGLTNITCRGLGGYGEIIDAAAFTGCTGLTKFDYIGSIQGWCRITFLSNPLSYTHNLYINGELITDLVIPDNVTEIKDYAFYDCSGLTSVSIGNGVTNIGDWAFYHCSGLTSVSIGNGVTNIGYKTFDYCNELTRVSYTGTIEDWCGIAFDYERSNPLFYAHNLYIDGELVTDLVIPNGVTSIGQYAFNYCSGLTNVTISDSVTSIGSSAFKDCSGLTSISVDPNNTVYDSRNNCNALIETATNTLIVGCNNTVIPDSVTSIGNAAFSGCISLASVIVPDGVTNIGNYAFSGCPAIRYAAMDSDGAKALSKAGYSFRPIGANYDLKYLYSGDEISGIELASVDKDITSFTMPNNVTSIAESVFSGCDKLTSITIPFVGLSPTATGDNARFYKIFGSKISDIPSSLKEVIITGGTSIKGYAFKDCSGLTSIIIPNSVTSIGNYAFENCSGLNSVSIPHSVRSIGENAFSGCSGLTRVNYTGTIAGWCGITFNSVDANPLHYAHNLYIDGVLVTDLVIPNGVTSIKQYSFSGCSGLTSVEIPDSVTSIQNDAFSGCSSLTNVTIGSGVTSIGDNGFSGCSCLASVTIPDGVTSISSNAFYNCPAIRYAAMDSDGAKALSKAGYSFRPIGENYDIQYLYSGDEISGIKLVSIDKDVTTFTIPNNVTVFDYNVFKDCTKLTRITIPFVGLFPNATGDNARFYKIFGSNISDIPSSLKEVVITGGTSIGDTAFYGCSGLTSITIPNSVTSIGRSAFGDCSSLTRVSIPDSVRNIGDMAFNCCNSMTRVDYTGTIADWCGITFSSLDANPLYYAHNLYIDGEIVTDLVITDGVTSISDYAFYGCSSLTSITIGNSVTSIGSSAFSGCNSLTSVEISVSVTSIGSYAFSGCSSLTSIEIPVSVTSIGNHAFSGCSGLTSITIPFVGDKPHTSTDTYQYPFGYIFGTYSYDGGTATTQSYYGSSTSSMTSTTYYIPTSLKSVTINGCSYIPSYAFHRCSGLTSVTIGNSVTSIGGSAFEGCSDLTSVTLESDANVSNAYLYFTKDNICYQVLNKNSVSVTSNSYSGDVVIPATVTAGNTFPVTSIGGYAFNGCSGLTSITIPESVTSIGNYAFYSCSGLTSIEIPDSVTIIGVSAFYGCRGLTSVTIPDGVTGIGNYAFYSCSGLISIDIPNSVTSIGSSAFQNCSGLTSVTIPNSVTSIGSSAFQNCSGLTSVTIPNSVTSIGSSAFQNCSGLTSVSLPESMTNIDSSVFYGCDALDSIYTPTTFIHLGASYSGEFTIPSGITSIAERAFSGCTGLTSITIPDSVTSIGGSAFNNCSSLTSVTIPDSVTSIGSYAFSGCSGLTSVTIGNGVRSIGSYAFSSCSGLTSVTMESDANVSNAYLYFTKDNICYQVLNKNSVSVTSNSYSGDVVISATVTAGNTFTVTSIGISAFSNCTGLTSVTIGNNVTSIGSSAFQNCSGLTSVTIPNSVTSIGGSAFQNCSGLTSVTIPNSVTSIGSSAFQNCSGLTSVTIPNSVTSIGSSAFRNCSGLTSVSLPESMTNIDSSVFYGCDALDSIYTPTTFIHLGASYSGEFTIPSGITSIAERAFSGCTGLTSITIPDSVTSIGGSAFNNCSCLTSVTIPDSVTSIGSQAFYNCSSLTSVCLPESMTNINIYTILSDCDEVTVYTPTTFIHLGAAHSGEFTIPSSITRISGGAFSNCSGLTSVTIPSSVTSIGNYAFNNCSGLTSVTIPDSVMSIGSNAFENCSGLTSIELPTSVTSIDDMAFVDCSGLTSVTIPDSVTSIGRSVFCYCSSLTSIEIPNSVTSIGDGAFYGCSGLTSVTIPDSVTEIGSGAFGGCSSLESITIPFVGDKPHTSTDEYQYPFGYIFGTSSYDGGTATKQYYYGSSIGYETNTTYYIPTSLKSVTITGSSYIPYGAFYNCTSLTNITIPDSVTKIGGSAFYNYNCSVLTTLNVKATTPPTFGSYMLAGCSALTTIYVPTDSVDAYKAASGWSSYADKIEGKEFE